MKEQIALLIIGAFIGAAVSQFFYWWRKRTRTKNNFGAISAEVDLAKEFADQLSTDLVMAPSYRLPTLAYESTFPSILAAGGVSTDEARTLMKFYSLVESINRGLDLAAGIPHTADSIKAEDHPVLSAYHSRNCAKADKIIPLHYEVRKILDAKL